MIGNIEGHTYSKRALEQVMQQGNRKCPTCRSTINMNPDQLKVSTYNPFARPRAHHMWTNEMVLLAR